MKVLIIDGSNPITWYYGLEGKVFPITHIKDTHYFVLDEAIPFIDTSCGPCGVHFPDGLLLYTEDEYNRINHHLQQGRELIKEFIIERDGYLELLEAKKVVLPEEVAICMQTLKDNGFSAYGMINYVETRDFGEGFEDELRVLVDYVCEGLQGDPSNGDLLIQAFLHGYTIEPEPTPKEKAIQWMINHGMVARGKSAHDVVSAIISILEEK